MRIPTEHAEQVNFVNWLEFNYPEHKVFAIPNGEHRAISVAQRLKAEGVRKGVPDLFIPSLKLFIEMKRQKGSRTTQEQKDWLAYLDSCGYYSSVCKGFEEAKKEFLSVLEIKNKK